MILWHIGNTTVRTPYRLRDALQALQDSSLNGNLSGVEQENSFASLLHNQGLLNAPRVERNEDASDLGRKWRSALDQLGFITPRLDRNRSSRNIDNRLVEYTESIPNLSGRAYELTPNGRRLANAAALNAQQECLLRSLASYRIPSIIESRYRAQTSVFSPLRYVLRIISKLGEMGLGQRLSFGEFALFVQTSTPDDGLEPIVLEIREFRSGRAQASNKKTYDTDFYEEKSQLIHRQVSTLNDYADLTFRYLKATGLFQASGRGIVLSPVREQIALLLLEDEATELANQTYLQSLWQGADLPTDDSQRSRQVVIDLTAKLEKRGIQIRVPSVTTPPQDLEKHRHELEDQIMRLDEQDYAGEQAAELGDIVRWMKAIVENKKDVELQNGTKVSIPKGEKPAYLEWIVWRAFLAIDNMCNAPWEARRFQIDQDFLPVHCAPGGGPDMIFEFSDAVVVVEVTLTMSSRQEAAEGEPVRRHVAQYVEQCEKEVYGLFIAIDIDSNTAHTFRLGDWFLQDDRKISLSIVPMKLVDFSRFIESGEGRLTNMAGLLRQLLVECRSCANRDAPDWKREVSRITRTISEGYHV